MPKKSKTYRVVGTAPVVVEGERWAPNDVFEANPAEVGFLLEIGALKELQAAPKKD